MYTHALSEWVCTYVFLLLCYCYCCSFVLQKKGVHLYQTCPSGNYYEYRGIAIGARSQSARTYLEKHFESFPNRKWVAVEEKK